MFIININILSLIIYYYLTVSDSHFVSSFLGFLLLTFFCDNGFYRGIARNILSSATGKSGLFSMVFHNCQQKYMMITG